MMKAPTSSAAPDEREQRGREEAADRVVDLRRPVVRGRRGAGLDLDGARQRGRDARRPACSGDTPSSAATTMRVTSPGRGRTSAGRRRAAPTTSVAPPIDVARRRTRRCRRSRTRCTPGACATPTRCADAQALRPRPCWRSTTTSPAAGGQPPVDVAARRRTARRVPAMTIARRDAGRRPPRRRSRARRSRSAGRLGAADAAAPRDARRTSAASSGCVAAPKLLVNASRGATTTSTPRLAVCVMSSNAAADLVGLHVGAGDHRDAEQDRDRGQRRAQLALRQAAQGERRSCASALRWSRISSTVGSACVVDDAPVGEEEDAVGDRGRAGVVGDHHDRLAELVDGAAQQRRGPRGPRRESRLPVGSSAKTTAGRVTSARATATRCCWPPDSSRRPVVRPVAEADGRRSASRASSRSASSPPIRTGSSDVLLGGRGPAAGCSSGR